MIVETADSSSRSLTPAASLAPDRVLAVDLDLDVQPVVHQQHRLGRARVLAAVADVLRRVGEPRGPLAQRDVQPEVVDGVERRVRVAALEQREVRRRAASRPRAITSAPRAGL